MAQGRTSRALPVTFEALESKLGLDGFIEAIEVDHLRGLIHVIYDPFKPEVNEGAHIPKDEILTADTVDQAEADRAAHIFGIMDMSRRD